MHFIAEEEEKEEEKKEEEEENILFTKWDGGQSIGCNLLHRYTFLIIGIGRRRRGGGAARPRIEHDTARDQRAYRHPPWGPHSFYLPTHMHIHERSHVYAYTSKDFFSRFFQSFGRYRIGFQFYYFNVIIIINNNRNRNGPRVKRSRRRRRIVFLL